MQLTADSGNCGDEKLSVTDFGRKSVSDDAKYERFVRPHRVGEENLNCFYCFVPNPSYPGKVIA